MGNRKGGRYAHTHSGRRLFWSGDFLAKCGWRVKKGTKIKRRGWGKPSCPDCREAMGL